MKLLEEIQREHNEVRTLFLQIENDEEHAEEHFNKLVAMVLSHHEAEEQEVFPELPEDKEAQELKLELIAEHANMRRSMQVVLDTDPEDDNWEARCKVVKEVFSHHIEEEEKELFSKLRDELSATEFERLYTKFESTEAKALKQAEKATKEKMILKPEDALPHTKNPAESKVEKDSSQTKTASKSRKSGK